jgi:hypothetical protein
MLTVLDPRGHIRSTTATRNGLDLMNLPLRFLAELASFSALGYWGFSVDASALVRVAAGIGTPALAVAAWALFLAPRAPRRLSDPSALGLEAIVFVGSAAALAATGSVVGGTCLGSLALGNAITLRALGGAA